MSLYNDLFEAGNVRIIGLSGSPRLGGNTDFILQETLAATKAEGADVNLIRIFDYHLKPCNGCMACFNTKKCGIEDDVEKLY